jgi:formylmethanofuran dehydrogenase subunit B
MPLVCLDIALFPTTVASDVVLPGVIDAMECSGTFGRLGHTCPATSIRFTDSPFSFTKSNEDTMRQLFAKIKQMA